MEQTVTPMINLNVQKDKYVQWKKNLGSIQVEFTWHTGVKKYVKWRKLCKINNLSFKCNWNML